MANREFFHDTKATQQGLILMPFTIAMAADTTGVIASTFPAQTSKTRLPRSFMTAARTGVGIVTITLTDGYTGLEAGDLSIINSGSWLAAFYAQWSKALPFTPTAALSTLTIHIGNATVLADPASAYGITGALWLTNSTVPR